MIQDLTGRIQPYLIGTGFKPKYNVSKAIEDIIDAFQSKN